MSDRTDWRISTLLHSSAERFEEHSKRVGKILDRAQEKFEKDHSSAVGSVGLVLLLGSMVIALWKEQWAVSGIGLVIGGILVIAALVIRHRSGVSQMKYAETMVNLEREHARFQQRSAMLQHIWLHGLPEGTPLSQIQLLLGDSTSLSSLGEGQARWKALPSDLGTGEVEDDSDR